MRIRLALVDDAPEMGRAMVESWLSGHPGQMPAAAWEKRRDEWTPEVSGRVWERSLRERDAGEAAGDVVLLAANLRARGFYEAMGGRDIGERWFDEEGHQLAERLYQWPDISVLCDRHPGRA